MTPEEQRIAIAEACGFERWTSESKRLIKLTKPRDAQQRDYWILHGATISSAPVDVIDDLVPDYLNDLNACAEMEKVLPENKQLTYDARLFDAVNTSCGELHEKISTFKVLHAAAAQRAEAFLKTLNLWKG